MINDDMLEKSKKVKRPLPPEAEDDGPPTGPDGKPLKPRPFAKGGMCGGGKAMKKMSGGGSASSRADGIASKGKTRGKIC
jgi:hypothetical protein